MTTQQAECPECAAAVGVMDPERGEIVECAECGVELEVVSVQPVTLQVAPEEGEDWRE